MSDISPTRAAILGTAGHIDHGKTALIERMSGINTDRLPEERKRGISIELGFAFIDLPSGRRMGVVDVPGHERFVKQMLAGVGGMDLVMLVIAADEGVMPQTREHMEIVDLLQVPDGFIALTKTDLTPDAEWLEVVEADVEDAIKGTIFEGKPIIRCSAKTGDGIDDVARTIDERIAAVEFAARGRETRLPIDRIFVLQGFGSLVTGTLWNGGLEVGDPVTLLPSGIETRVKSVEVHGEEVKRAVAGQRVAVSLHRVDREKISRGDWLVKSDALRPAHMMDAWFKLLDSAARPLKNRARVRIHLGASELLARVILLDREELAPGERAPIQLRLESPGVAEAGDRFVIRSYSPMRAIGGGVIVAPVAAKRRRFKGDPEAEFKRLDEGTPVDRMCDLLETEGLKGQSAKKLRAAMGLSTEEFGAALEEARAASRVLGENRLFSSPAFDTAMSLVLDEIDRHIATHPFLWGVPVGELKRQLGRQMDPALFDLVRKAVARDGRAEERQDQIAPAGRPHDLPNEAADLADRLLAELDKNGYAPPDLGKTLAALGDDRAADLATRLHFEGRLVQVSQDFSYLSDRIRDARAKLEEHFVSNDTLSVGEAKTLLGGISRRHIVPLMEFFDRCGWSRRDGDVRVRGAGLSE